MYNPAVDLQKSFSIHDRRVYRRGNESELGYELDAILVPEFDLKHGLLCSLTPLNYCHVCANSDI
jgi:hypothetical protein